ncbi:hypothetical protein ACFZAR_36395 [Streptomyces sp. NPDC008222]|uniref:hypothetical protein n=1 Tax=Streptomyces sp. NPDC008222 TaxID=3364820 RepID=UPI0036DFDF03
MLDTTSQYTPAWHATQEADERAWLDQWARLHLIPVIEHPEPPTAAPVPSLATTGSH